MADQPPPGPVSTPLPPPASTAVPAPVGSPLPPPAKSGRSCFGCGCGGCLLAIVLVVLLVLGSGYYFFIVQAQAAVPAPAALQIISTPVDVDTSNGAGFHTGTPGQELKAGNSVKTGDQGHAAIQFPDGSFVRMSPNTEVKVTAAQLSHDGNLQSASLAQKAGRTFTNVQHLVSGASFQVGGHSVSASVRGTQFELLVRANLTNLIKVFDGTVTVDGKTRATLNAGQQIDAAADGTLSGQGPIKAETADPYALEAQCARTVSTGTNAGTVQTSTGEGLATGQSAEADYSSPGGTLSIALCYPGSFMTLTIIDPNGASHSSRQSGRPVQGNLSGPPGRYRAIVKAEDAPGGEPWAISFATATSNSCSAENVDTGGYVRQTLSNDQLSQALASSGVTLQVQGTSPASARISYYSDLGGVPISWTVIFYAATPNLGLVLTQVTVRGINLTTQVAEKLNSAIGQSLSVPTDFTVDRVYSCKGSGGGVMVIEGHRATP